MVARHEQALTTSNIIPVDFKRKRRLGQKKCATIKITSFTEDSVGTVPRSFRLDTRLILIWEILDRWPGQDYRYLKIRSVDDVIYFLRHDMRRNEWFVIE
jgi:hypothetical protein